MLTSWLALAFSSLCVLQTATAIPVQSIAVPTLPALLAVTASPPSNGSTTTANNASTYIHIPPVSIDQQVYLTINICALSSSLDYPIVLVTNASSLFPESSQDDANSNSTSSTIIDQPDLDPYSPSMLAAKRSTDRSSGFNAKDRANAMTELFRAQYVWTLKLDGNAGFANWTGWMADGGIVAVFGTQGDHIDLELGIQVAAPIHSLSLQRPFLGDTTASQSLIYSPVLESLVDHQVIPTYPNYTLSSPAPARLDIPSSPAGIPLTVQRQMFPVILPTTVWARSGSTSQTGPINGSHSLHSSMCAITRSINQTADLTGFASLLYNASSLNLSAASTPGGTDLTDTILVQRPEGWRWDWLTRDLQPNGINYTVYAIEPRSTVDDRLHAVRGILHGPIHMITKEDDFPCPLVHGLELCPSIGYAAPLEPPTQGFADAITRLDDRLAHSLASSLQSFSTSLLTSACGRDLYSQVSTCADCFDEYRQWLCRSILPRCASRDQVEMSHNRTALRTEHVDALVPMTIQRSNNNPRTIYSADPSYPYDELLPCLSGCRRVDRKCPVYLGFRCPLRGVTANSSYAYCGRDKESGGDCEGEEDGGADIWGNVWCNGYVDSS